MCEDDVLFEDIFKDCEELTETYKDIFGEVPQVASQKEQEVEELLLKMHKHRREES